MQKTMILSLSKNLRRVFYVLIFTAFSATTFAQQDSLPKARPEFWNRVQIGGGIGAGFGGGYTNVTLAPSAIYRFNQYVAAGVGLSGSYSRQKDYDLVTIDEFRSWIYGGSIIGLFNPIDFIQISLELEQLRVNSRIEYHDRTVIHDDFWNTGLFVGAGYSTRNVTIGLRYNVLFDDSKTVYGDALMPFVRVYF